MKGKAPEESLLALNQQEEVVDLLKDYPLSASEDEEDNDGERKHQKLLETIGRLDGKNRQRLAERSEASLQVSEFSVSTEGTGEKLELAELLAPIKPSSSLGTVKKRLKKVKNKKTVELPLSKEENERIHREAAYNKTSQDMDKWDPVVLKNRRAAQLVFPLEQEQVLDAPIEEVLGAWKARTPLEQEIFNLLHKNKQPLTDPLLTPVEKASLKAMSLEEAKQRRAELQKARALQSYYEAKARRQKKIKSKKFHKVLKKRKAKEVLKQFEKLQKVNPTAALEELEKMEKARMEERMSLKHQNSGKWAKSKAIMAKYDLEARKAMQEQLTKNKELTQKLQVPSDSEHDEDAEEDSTLIPDIVNEVQMSIDGPNPWMQKNRGINTQASHIQKKPVAGEESEPEEEEKAGAEEDALLQEVEERRSLWKGSEVNQGSQKQGLRTKAPKRTEEDKEVLAELRTLSKHINKKAKKVRQVGKQHVSPAPAAPKEPSVQREEQSLLDERPERVQTMEDIESLGMEEVSQEQKQLRPGAERRRQRRQQHNHPEQRSPPKVKQEPMIDLHTIITVKTHKANSSLSFPTIVDEEDCDEEVTQKQIIKEAFAGDDVIADFQKEKCEADKASKPKDIDLSLPGWGQWGGPGLVISARKRRRFLIKAPKATPRKDKCLPNVVISEKRNIQAAAHQVNVLPFPFTHQYQFEETIKTPVGTTWNTQRAFQKLTAPRVVTKPGHIIEPIKEKDVESSSSHLGPPTLQRKAQQHAHHRRRRLKKAP
ncbi:U3 small nucleolar RNA-associated protein 14 homolog A isoform X2 [Phascolarctos cinereus]|uniref:U3 small nucleolar RNA-associated protein 14 homolog A isoform X2 n=1 Tax=Phascolarctos cinereus TaxID=38626 RepID=A0A6P5J2U0_PHACI|nr:U3 small nucleolar RNA-associated protein 14 homolog A isoform X2 [Phascolarctos cinereus]